jgi:hypothetical protein
MVVPRGHIGTKLPSADWTRMQAPSRTNVPSIEPESSMPA